MAIANLAISAIGSIFGVIFNIVWQLVLCIQDIITFDFKSVDMWTIMEVTARNSFENIFYEGFKPAIFFMPFYSMFAMALPYAFYIFDVNF